MRVKRFSNANLPSLNRQAIRSVQMSTYDGKNTLLAELLLQPGNSQNYK
jgi:hypothetical protein